MSSPFIHIPRIDCYGLPFSRESTDEYEGFRPPPYPIVWEAIEFFFRFSSNVDLNSYKPLHFSQTIDSTRFELHCVVYNRGVGAQRVDVLYPPIRASAYKPVVVHQQANLYYIASE